MDNEKKGIFGRITGSNKKKSSCCNIEIEEIPEEENVKVSENSSSSCCSGSSGCCSNKEEVKVKVERKKITIDFLFLDLSVCTRCQGAESNLDEALKDVSHVLEATGTDVVINKVNVNTEELAVKYKFLTSPTIRVNGRDIQMEYKESLCESCGDLCGDEVDCRVWIYQGNEYTEPPKAMIIEGILKEVYGGVSNSSYKEDEYVVPDNLKHFYRVMKEKK
ncbi:DUF2703 domain-containing protein [Sedimentibacter saalensis]|uniref:Uncharacterized protein DUF2703 n=1 Tax=Sedimentibacter saalensis TaxID=130788 RepID=A0A562J579_9FIRM|nr:DUF2703 domain-containing protein [Sedimentibacter saalensis]MEA5093674.1 DUF2703 domain-containing protein [Sedimentibacter saalensis]TWH78338.1 uncharacterized protein DUF2703 [Sedimentibacter saalensis]